MSNKDLSRKPHNVRGRPDIWWYEGVRGIEMYVEFEKHVEPVTIKWDLLRAALSRLDKP